MRKLIQAPVGVLKNAVNQGLQVILGIIDIGERSVVKDPKGAVRRGQRAAGKSAYMLQSDGIALLGHDAADLHIAITESEIAELDCAPLQQILREAADIEHADGKN
jgi:hypothetical protein